MVIAFYCCSHNDQTLLMGMFLSSVLKFILIFFWGAEMCADPYLSWMDSHERFGKPRGITYLNHKGFHFRPEIWKLGLGLHLLIDFGLSAEIANTILKYKPPSTRKLHAIQWQLFVSWCEKLDVDPVNCPVSQEHLTTGLALATLKV